MSLKHKVYLFLFFSFMAVITGCREELFFFKWREEDLGFCFLSRQRCFFFYLHHHHSDSFTHKHTRTDKQDYQQSCRLPSHSSLQEQVNISMLAWAQYPWTLPEILFVWTHKRARFLVKLHLTDPQQSPGKTFISTVGTTLGSLMTKSITEWKSLCLCLFYF